MLLLTAKLIVQMPLAASTGTVKLKAVAPVNRVPPEEAPGHVPPSAVPDETIPASVSETTTLFRIVELLLDRVRITEEFPPG